MELEPGAGFQYRVPDNPYLGESRPEIVHHLFQRVETFDQPDFDVKRG